MLLGVVFKLGALALSILITVSTYKNLVVKWFLPKRNESLLYDFIVVGGGSAGSTVAGRLAENGFTILLLEAGGPPPWWETLGTIDIPIFGPLWQRTELDWAYVTEPQSDSCGALKKRSSLWPRGRVLGGSGRLNNMVYMRGHEKDWESWGFSASSQLHYFKKSEFQLGSYANDTLHHSLDGWMPVSDMPMTTSLSAAILEAAREVGYYVGDLNTMTHTGFMEVQTTTFNGARFSADSAFLYSGKLKNLNVVTNAHVGQVLLSKSKEARGVKFYHLDKWQYARSKHGVILSAGAVGSPKILLQSGIGPVDHLIELGIPVKIPLHSVGKNLLDHISTGSDLILLNSSLSLSLPHLAHPKSFWDYAFYGKGPLTHGGCEATGLLYTSNSDPRKDPPDVQILVLPAGQTFDEGTLLRHNMGVTDEVWEQYFLQKPVEHPRVGVTVLVILLHPWSHGEVKLKSKNPFDAPHIDPQYLKDPRDVEILVEGIYAVKKLLQTKAMAELGAHLNTKHMPGCEEFDFDTHNYWKCYSRMLSYTVYHPAGTCRMGHKGSAVVDYSFRYGNFCLSLPQPLISFLWFCHNSFRVHGSERLYVVDASVMPTLPSANINAAVIALAERAADYLRRQARQENQPYTRPQTYISVMRTHLQNNSCTGFVNYTSHQK